MCSQRAQGPSPQSGRKSNLDDDETRCLAVPSGRIVQMSPTKTPGRHSEGKIVTEGPLEMEPTVVTEAIGPVRPRDRRVWFAAVMLVTLSAGGVLAWLWHPTRGPGRAEVTLVVTYSARWLGAGAFTTPHDVSAAAQAARCHAYWLNATGQGTTAEVQVRLLLSSDRASARLPAIRALPGVRYVERLEAGQFDSAPTSPGSSGVLDCLLGTLSRDH